MKEYDLRLSKMRKLAYSNLTATTIPRIPNIGFLIYDRKKNDILYHSEEENRIPLKWTRNEAEIIRISKRIQPDLNPVFEHAPDLEDFSHIIALCKAENEELMSIAYTKS